MVGGRIGVEATLTLRIPGWFPQAMGVDVVEIAPVHDGVYAISVVLALLVLALGTLFIWQVDRWR